MTRRQRIALLVALLLGLAVASAAMAQPRYYVFLPSTAQPAIAVHKPTPAEYCATGLGQLKNQSIGVCGNEAAAVALELANGTPKVGEFAGPIYNVTLQISQAHAQAIGYPNGATLYEVGGSRRFPEREPIGNTPMTFDLPSGRFGLGGFVEAPPVTPSVAPTSAPTNTPTTGTPAPTATVAPTATTAPTTTPVPTYCEVQGMVEVPGWNRHICGDQRLVTLAQGLLPGQVRAGTFSINVKELPADHGYPARGVMFYGNSQGVEEMSVVIPLGQSIEVQLSSDSGGVNPIWGLGPAPEPVDACPGDQIDQLQRMSTGVCGDAAAQAANTAEGATLGQLIITQTTQLRLWINPAFAGTNPGHPFADGACLYKQQSAESLYVPAGGDVNNHFVLTVGTWGLSSDLSCKN